MNRRGMFSLAVAALIGLCATCIAVAQEKQRVSMKTPAENTKYTQQLFIDVGDAPGHQVRVYEIHRTYPSNPPVFNGVKLVESWSRGTSDYNDSNGLTTGYDVYVLENGDKFFAMAIRAQTPISSGSSGRSRHGHRSRVMGAEELIRPLDQ
jgi:hypothetical protein